MRNRFQDAVELIVPVVGRDTVAVRDYIGINPTGWWKPFEYFWGQKIRGELILGGFEDLADDWVAIVEEAVKLK